MVAVLVQATAVALLAERRNGSAYGALVFVVVGFSELVRTLSLGAPVAPGEWAGAWTFPRSTALPLVLWYFTYALVPFAIAWSRLPTAAVLSWALVSCVGGLVNGLLPVEPPWLTGTVPRLVDSTSFSWVVSNDIQPAAAFPSLHVGVPAAVAMGARSVRWGGYACVTSVVVVAAGEHWALDVVGGWLLAWCVVQAVKGANTRTGVLGYAGVRQNVRDGV